MAKAKSQSIPDPLLTELPPLGMDAKSLAADVSRHFNHTLGCDIHSKYRYHRYEAVAITLRDRLMDRWKHTHYSYRQLDCKRAYYLSLEFLMGRTLGNAVLNLNIEDQTRQALRKLGMQMEDIEDIEPDAGLGNGGLGRLAACFLDSCATLQLPVMGLRHTLRVWDIPPAHRQRRADRGAGPLAERRQSVGARAAGVHAARALRRPYRA